MIECEIPDTSSDTSSDTIIIATENSDSISRPGTSGGTVKHGSELDEIFKKYLSDDDENVEIINNFDVEEKENCSFENKYDNLENFDPCCSPFKYEDIVDKYKLNDCSDSEKNSDVELVTSENDRIIESEKSSNSDKEKKKMTRKRKVDEKNEKKEDEQRSKAAKDALKNFYKNLKPENCMKFIRVHFDEDLQKKEYFGEISNNLENNNISFVIESQIIPFSVKWTRHLDTHFLNENGQLIDLSKNMKIDEIVHIIDSMDFINHIHNNSFLEYIENLRSILDGCRITLVIYGLLKYFKFQKNKTKQEFAEAVSGKVHKTLTDRNIFKDAPVISRRNVEYVLTEVQFLHSISHRFLENPQELSLFIFQITKSLAQLPYKREKEENLKQAKWYMPEDKKNCVRVDKNGNGLSRLWKQIITTFPLASLETAEAITNIYPSPMKLMEAYDKLNSVEEGEKLLQDIPIRRNAGPISSSKKLGIELSKKIYYFFNSTDPNRII